MKTEAMLTPEQLYQMPNQRGHLQDPQGSTGNDGDDADAEGEREYSQLPMPSVNNVIYKLSEMDLSQFYP